MDKFIGYCSLPCLSKKNRLNIKIKNEIDLNENNKSDIMVGKQVWKMSELEIEEFEKDKSYMWWNNES